MSTSSFKGTKTFSGSFNLDNSLLYADTINNRIGINVGAPTDTLSVKGTVEVDAVDGASSFDFSSLGAFTVRTTTEDDPLSIIRYSTSGGGTINLRRSNTDTLGSLSPVLSGGTLGTLSFGGYNSSAYDDGAQIRGYASENWSATVQGSNLRFYTNPIGGSAVIERMRIDSEGLITAGTGSGTSLGAWTSWTPTLTGWTLGDGTLACSYCQIGKIVHFRFRLNWGTTTAISTSQGFTLPVTAATSTSYAWSGVAYDTSAAAIFSIISYALGSSTAAIRYVSSNLGATAAMTGTIPITWASGDYIAINGTYEAA